MSIEIRHIKKTFGAFAALKDVSFKVETGELMALLGPSGSGKTSLLRIIAGIEVPDDNGGSILIHDEDATSISLRDRRVGFVFQHYALFRHMTIFENVAFGLRVRPRRFRASEKMIKEKVDELLKLVQLDWLGDRYPSQLSGGQRQRIALARALAVEPSVLLLDEPFGSLDARVRKELRRWLRRFHDELKITSVFVTHDQEEALEVADRVVLMNEGRVEQVGTPEEVYHHPANAFVYNFLGNVNLFHSRVEEGKAYLGEIPIDLPAETNGNGSRALVFVRPHLLEIEHERSGADSFHAKVTHVNAAGSFVKIDLVTDWGDPVHVELSHRKYRALGLKREDEVFVRPTERKVFVEDEAETDAPETGASHRTGRARL
jgi:sulfate/thiosulfate transport system ATP-binding protein